MKAAIYLRVSTSEQANEGISLAAQEAKLLAYCNLRDLDVVEVVTDAGVSAGKPLASREGGKRVLDLVQRKQVQAVVAYKLDRLFRNCVDCLSTTSQWDKKGIALHLIDLGGSSLDTTSSFGRFFLTIMAGAAELERSLVSDRTKTAMSHKKALGQRIGTLPYGSSLSDDGTTLNAHDNELELIQYIGEARYQGLSQRAIVADLAQKGFTTRKGTPIRLTQVQRILKTHYKRSAT